MSGMDTNAPIGDSQRECMSLWMAYALERMPYLASTLLAMRPVSSPGLGTVAVDAGYRLYIDFPAMTQHSDRFCSEALLHEAMHLLSDHASRSKPFPGCASAWNIAADCEINDGLVEAGCSELAEACVLPEHIGQPRHLLAEEYMEAQQGQQQGQGYELDWIDLFCTRPATATGDMLREEVVVLRWPGRMPRGGASTYGNIIPW